MKNIVISKVYKYRKGIIVGTVLSLFFSSMLFVANVSAHYGMELKAQELEQRYEQRDFLVNDFTSFVFRTFLEDHYTDTDMMTNFITYQDAIEKAEQVMLSNN